MTTQSIIHLGERLWRLISPMVPPRVLDALGRFAVRILFWYSDRNLKNDEGVVPPAGLRYRVWGDPDISTFLWSGKHCAQDIEAALGGPDALCNYKKVLDFGCGCRRIARFLLERIPTDIDYWGTDIDEEAISWCRTNHPEQKYVINSHRPPLDFPSDSFDLILAIAVFRHFSEQDQLLWLAELQRVLKPGGRCLISLHGEFCWKNFTADEIEKIRRQGIFCKPIIDPYQRSVFPKWYQATYHTKAYATREYARYFVLEKYIEQGIENETDLLVLRKSS